MSNQKQQWQPNKTKEEGKLAPKESDWNLAGAATRTRTRHGGAGRPNLKIRSAGDDDESYYCSSSSSTSEDDATFVPDSDDEESSSNCSSVFAQTLAEKPGPLSCHYRGRPSEEDYRGVQRLQRLQRTGRGPLENKTFWSCNKD